MKKIIAIFISLIALPALGEEGLKPITEFNPIDSAILCQVDIPPLKIKSLAGYELITSAGCYQSTDIGKPSLPVRRFFVLLPPDTEVKDVTITSVEQSKLAGEYNLKPVSPPIPISKGFTTTQALIFQGEDFYPENILKLNSIQKLRGYSITCISVFGACYNPKTKQLIWNKQVNFKLNLISSKTKAISSTVRGLQEDEELVKGLVVNPELVTTYPQRLILSVGDTYKYIVITNEGLTTAFEQLCATKPMTTKVVTISWIRNNYAGIDDQKRIRAFITDYYTRYNTRYVLLGGDVDIVPYRGVYAKVPEGSNLGDYIDSNIPCDLYYACFDGDWNADGDNIYGELEDEVDLSPEVWIGRAPVSTLAEATNFVNKVITCENIQDNYIYNELLIGYVLYNKPPYFCDGKEIMEEIDYWTPGSYTVYKEYQTEGGVSNDRIIADINSGVGLIAHANHANWNTAPPFNIGYPIDVKTLNNGSKTFIFNTIGCIAGDFSKTDCIGEEMILNQNGGAVAFIGNSRYGWFDKTDVQLYSGEYQIEFFEKFFKEGYTRVGETLGRSKMTFTSECGTHTPYRWLMFCLNLLGDPAMEFRFQGTPTVASILISPTAGTVGSIVTVSGDGFGSTELIRIDFGTTRTINMVTANSSGTFATTFTTDTQPYGTTRVIATGLDSGRSVLNSFRTILAPIVGPVTVYDAFGNFIGNYTTIQAGVNACPVDGTVSAAAGTYNEAVYINKRIALVGVGTSTIDPPSGNGVEFSGSGVNNALISGFKITGANYGIYCTNGNPIITNNTISGNSSGIYCYDSSPTISNCTINDSQDYAVALSGNSYPTFATNTFTNNTYNGIKTSVSTGTWTDPGIPYIIASDLVIPSNGILTIKPGVIVKFRQSGYGNYVNLVVNGTLIADGTPDNKIVFTSIKDDTYGGDTNNDDVTTTPGKGDWDAIKFNATANNSILDNCIVRYGGGYNSESQIYLDSASPIISNCTINNSQGYAIALSGNSYPTFTANTFTNNTYNGIKTSVSTGTWTDSGIPYIIASDLAIPSNGILTIKPGVIVKFRQSGYGNYVNFVVNGTLIADGTPDNKIVFTSIKDDTYGGDTNNDDVTTTPGKGDWDAIKFNITANNSILDNCIVRYGGGYNSESQLYLDSASPIISNCTITNSQDYGIALSGNSYPTFATNIFTNNTYNGIKTSVSTGTWADPGIPYIIASDLAIPSNGILTIKPGVIVKFRQSGYGNYVNLVVNGTLIADGTPDNNIVFTSIKDDPYGGDTNNDDVTTTPGKGDWDAIKFNATANNSILDNCIVRYGGGYNSESQIYLDSASPIISNCTINNSQDYGIALSGNSYPTFATNTFTNNTYNGIKTSVSTGTWADPGIPYIIASDLAIPSNGTLTIKSGVIVKFRQSGYGNYVNLCVNGILIADGTPDNKIVFTSIKDDTYGGDTNNDDVTTIPGRGDWDAIKFNATAKNSILDNCIVRYGGGYNSESQIYLDSASPTISNCTITDSQDYAVALSGNSYPTFATNTFTNNTYNGIKTSVSTGTWADPGIPYIIASDLAIPSNVTLTIKSGVIVKFRQSGYGNYVNLVVNGTLIADGTPDNKIVFTSIKDDTYGGDTNNDDVTTTPGKGDWDAIKFNATAKNSILDNCIVRYGGGYNSECQIYLDSASPTISNCTISDSQDYGIYLISSNPTILNSTISNNSNYGIYCVSLSNPNIAGNIISNNSSGICCHSSNPTITNNTISGNSNHGIYCQVSSSSTITNNIITENGITSTNYYGIYKDSGIPIINYNDVWKNGQGGSNNYYNCSDGIGGISANPQFIGGGDFHLGTSSPCIDKGTNTALGIPSTDKDGNPRIVNGIVDMGAYEYQGTSTPTTGSLTITSTPSNARIYLDGADTGYVTNRTFTNISAGTHTIKLTLSNYKDWYGTATVTTLTTSIYATLTPIPPTTGSLTITSTPPGARIYLDSTDTTQLTPATLTTTPGTHTIKLILSGYNDWYGTTTVTAGSTTNVYATLTTIPSTTGSFTITSTPLGAKIYLDGTDTGSVTTHTFTNISPGTHTIKLTLSGYKDWYGTATVTAGLTTYVYATLTQVGTFPTTLAVFPESKSAILGSTFTLQINLSDVPDFDSVGVYLSFDPQILEVISLTQGAFPAGGGVIIKQFNNGSGTIDYAVGLTQGTAKGSGTVLTILFNPKAQGTTTLNFDFIAPRKTEMLNGINSIPFNHKNGEITVGINNPPVAIISAPLRPVKVNDLVTLDGSNSYDPDGNPITYYWRQIAGPQITMANPTTATITFTPVQVGNYTFELTVTDDKLASGSATVTVVVTDTLLTISPASIEVGIQNNFNLDVVLSKAKEFDSAGVYLSFDPNILEVTGLTQGPFPPAGSVIISQFNNGNGTIDYAVGLTSGTTQGTGTVLTISFKAKAITGTTTLTFNFNPPRNTEILKGTASVPFAITEGKIIIVPYGSLDGYVLFDIPRQSPHAGIEISIGGTELKATTTNTGYFLINNVLPITYLQVFAYAPGASPRYWGSVTITAGAKTTLATLTLLNADANGDCMVSLLDFGYLKLAFLKTNINPGWYDSGYHTKDGYINSDFNGDGMVSLPDFGYLKLNFLHTTTPYRSPLPALPLSEHKVLLNGEPAILKVVPEKKEVLTGAEFDMNIDLLHAPDFDSVGVYLSFDPNMLEVTGLTQGTFPAGGGVIIKQFNNGSGTIDYAVGLTSGTATGTGTVLIIKLKAKGTGTTTLNFDFNPPRNTEILNGITPVPSSTQIGTMTITAPLTTVYHNAVAPLKAGNTLTVTLVGVANGTGTFDIGTLTTGRAMTQVSPGTYTGSYQVLPGNNVKDAIVTGHLLIGTTTYSLDATPTVTFDTIVPTFTIAVSPDPAKAGTVSIVVIASEQLIGTPSLIAKDSAGGTISTVLLIDANPVFTYSGTIATAQGTATVKVSGADLAGNPGSRTTTFQVDTLPAGFTITVPAYVKEGTFSLKVTANEKLLGTPSVTIKDSGSNTIAFELISATNLVFEYRGSITSTTAQGTATIEVSGTDTANNTGTQAGSFKVDTLAPGWTIIPAQDPAGIGTLTIMVTPDEPLVATPTLMMKDSANVAITATFIGYANGTYTYRATITSTCADGTATIMVKGTDTAGNAGSGTKTFQISIPRKLEIATGTSQTATVTTILQPFVVQLTDNLNRPIQGHPVKWMLVSAPATSSLSATLTTTNQEGLASITLTLGTKAGTYIVTAEGSLRATFTATAVPGTLTQIKVSPNPAYVTISQLFPFTATGYDGYGNDITGLSYTWTKAGEIGTLTPSLAGTSATLEAVSIPATGTITAATLTITGSTSVSIVYGELTSVTITPATATVEMLGSQSFTAQAFNQYNSSMGATYTWTLKTVGMGTLDATTGQTVVFTATKTGTVDLQVVAGFGTRTATATARITVVNGVVHHINITPATATIEARGTSSFTAEAYNQYGYKLTDVTKFVWQIVQGSGTVNGSPGQTVVIQTNDVVGTLTLVASTNTVTGTATVTVIHGSVTSVSINPPTASVEVMGSQTFAASSLNRFGHPIPASELNYTWGLISAIGGSITPTTVSATTTFTAGSKTGKVEIRAEAGGKKATVTVTVKNGTPTFLTSISGDGQKATVTTTLTPFIVQLTDNYGNPIGSYSVTWQIIAPGYGAKLSTTSTTTNVNGTTSTIFTLGTKTGIYQVIATGAGLPATFTATATYGTPTSLTIVSGNNQQATVTTTLLPYAVKVTDTYGNPVGSYAVTWQIIEPGYGAILSATLTTTNDNGTTSTIFTLGTKTGTYKVTARASGLPATFTATATYGIPTSLTGISGDGQKATVTTTLTPYAVKITDTYGNPVGSYSITWQIIEPGYGAKLSATLTTTNINGTTSTIFTLGTKTGIYQVTANISGLIATFTATATYGTPTSLTGISGDGQKATVTTTLTPLIVKLTDTHGNLIGSYSVTWQIIAPGYGAVLSATSTTTNVNGTTSTILTLGTKTGTYKVTANGAGLVTTFMATATTGNLTQVKVSPAPAYVTVNQPFPFTATGYDGYGNEIAGLSYDWTKVGPIGTLTPSPAGTSATLEAVSIPATGTITAATLTITGSTSVSIVYGELTSVTITPATATVEMSGTQPFTAQALNQYNSIMDATYTWTLKTAGMGTLDTTTGQTVVFTATKTGTVDLQVTAAFGTRTATATAKTTVINGVVHRIDITPATATIEARGTASFTAKAFNQYGYKLTDVTKFTWQIVEGSGTITGSPGSTVVLVTNDVVGTLTLTASTMTVTGTATVTVIHGSVTSVSINPSTASVEVMGSQTFVASALNQFGHSIPASELNYTWELIISNIGGSITPTTVLATTTFTAGSKTGKVEITVEAEGKGTTATITVTPKSIEKLVFVVPIIGTLTVGMSGAMTMQTQDKFGNPSLATNTTITVNGDEQSKFAEMSSGVIWTTSGTFTIAGTSNRTFFFKQNGTTTPVGNVTITATIMGTTTSATCSITILPLTGSSSGTVVGDDGQTTVEVGTDAVTGAGYIEIDTSGTSTADIVLAGNAEDDADQRINRVEGTLRRFEIHNATLTTTVRIGIPYPDADNDGYVDGVTPPMRESSLAIYHLVGTGTAARWQLIPSLVVDTVNNVVYADVGGFSFYILMGLGFEPNFEKALVYPNPYYPSKGHTVIYFDRLTENSTIQIFTIAGELVDEIRADSSRMGWDTRNSAGEKVASGIYIYLIKDPAGNKKVGKLGILR